MTIVILRTGDAIEQVAPIRGQFFRWIRDTADTSWSGDWVEHDVRVEGPEPPASAAAVIITGSPHSVTERSPWMLRAEAHIRAIHARGTPLLGICFGHQLIAQALGGLVTKNPRGREIGTVRVTRAKGHQDPLFQGVPDEFHANATHVDTVAELPPGARVLCSTQLEPHAAYAVGESTRCVQFHPEIDGDIMRHYVKARAHLIRDEGRFCPDALHDAVCDAPHSAALLRNFLVEFATKRRRQAA